MSTLADPRGGHWLVGDGSLLESQSR